MKDDPARPSARPWPLRAPFRLAAGLVWAIVIVASVALLVRPCAAQDVTPERVAALEDALKAVLKRSDAQAKRIEELELTLASVVTAQDDEVREGKIRTEIDKIVDEAMDHRAAELRGVTAGRKSGFTVNGQIRFVTRVFDGARISTDKSFELEHILLQMNQQLGDNFRVKLTPAASHTGSLALLEAYGAYTLAPYAEITGGEFLVPFNGVHQWAFPSDSFIEPFLAENSPKPFFYSPYWDTGLMLSGHLPFGDNSENDFFYAGYVTNGLDSDSLDGIHKRGIVDNNKDKTLGGRMSASFRLDERTSLTFGTAGMTGKYDPEDLRSFWAAEADVDFRTGPFSIYLEAFYRPEEVAATVIENPAATVVAATYLTGFKARPAYRLLSDLQVFVQADRLTVRQPRRTGGQFSVLALDDEAFTITTAEVGLKYDVTSNLRLVLEGGVFLRDATLGPDIRFLALTAVYTF